MKRKAGLTQLRMRNYFDFVGKKRGNSLPRELWALIWTFDGTAETFFRIWATEVRNTNALFWKDIVKDVVFHVGDQHALWKANLKFVTRIVLYWASAHSLKLISDIECIEVVHFANVKRDFKWKKLKNVRELKLSDVEIVDRDLLALEDVEYLYLGKCEFITRKGINFLKHCVKLRRLKMTQMRVTCRQLDQLEHLKKLTLDSHTFVEGVLPPNLQELSMYRDSNITTASFMSLRHVHLEHCTLKANDLGKLKNVVSADLKNCEIELCEKSPIRYLRLIHCVGLAHTPLCLRWLENLEYFSFSSSMLDFDHWFAPALRYIRISHNDVPDSLDFGSFPSGETFTVVGGDKAHLISKLRKLKNLKRLELTWCGECTEQDLLSLHGLEWLEICGLELPKTIDLRGLSNLRRFYNHCTGETVFELSDSVRKLECGMLSSYGKKQWDQCYE